MDVHPFSADNQIFMKRAAAVVRPDASSPERLEISAAVRLPSSNALLLRGSAIPIKSKRPAAPRDEGERHYFGPPETLDSKIK